jgi:hypothetical protein
MSTRRITVEEVLEAYRVTGILPCIGTYCTNKGEMACAIGALAIAAGSVRRGPVAYHWATEEFGSDYVHGFVAGFDDEGFDDGRRENTRAAEGFEDGDSVRKAVFQKQGAQA